MASLAFLVGALGKGGSALTLMWLFGWEYASGWLPLALHVASNLALLSAALLRS